MPTAADPVYQSYLVRCWLSSPATDDAPAVWHFELREVAAEPHIRRFGDLDSLRAFLAGDLDGRAERAAPALQNAGQTKGGKP